MVEPLLVAASLAGAVWLVRAGLREPGPVRVTTKSGRSTANDCATSGGCPGCSHGCPAKRN
jgi:hypothetical protein